MNAAVFPPDLRQALLPEILRWRAAPQQLDHVIRRAHILLATHLCGRLDGALLAMAREHGLLREGDPPDGSLVLDTDDARWLLLSVGLFGTGADPVASAGLR